LAPPSFTFAVTHLTNGEYRLEITTPSFYEPPVQNFISDYCGKVLDARASVQFTCKIREITPLIGALGSGLL
jgi:hypothetical protein